MRSRLLTLMVLLGSASSVGAEAPMFERGDRVAFIGDSITHTGAYHANAALFYATRYPDRPFTLINAGVSGDTAPGTNRRFAVDIAARRPNVATIMLGMNDSAAWCFSKNHAKDQRDACVGNAYATYAREMIKLLDSLDELGCRVTLITPSIYDQTAELSTENALGKNDLLEKFAGFAKATAEERGYGLIDFHGPMGELNLRLQRQDPTATIVGDDRVHPGAAGHLVMAFLFLKEQGVSPVVSDIAIDAAAGEATRSENCEIAALDASSTGVAFTASEASLPFPLAGDQLTAAGWIPFQKELNRQLLTVTHLDPGEYTLRIDGRGVGDYTADELATGVNLAGNRSTPQHEHAVRVKRVNDERLAVVSQLRALMHVRHAMISKLDPPVSEDDHQALAVALDAHTEKSKGKPWYSYSKAQVERFLAALPKEPSLLKREQELLKQMWVVNQPEPHAWTLTPTAGR